MRYLAKTGGKSDGFLNNLSTLRAEHNLLQRDMAELRRLSNLEIRGFANHWQTSRRRTGRSAASGVGTRTANRTAPELHCSD